MGVLKNYSCRVRWQIRCCSLQSSQSHLSFKSLCQRTTYLDIGALKDALLLTAIEFFSPWMFPSTHTASLPSHGAQHSVGSWFQAKPETPQTELVFWGVQFNWWERRSNFLFINSLFMYMQQKCTALQFSLFMEY